jgi:SNF2 family DNA or RNA helicase
MLDISKLKNRKTLIKLKEYSGKNEYILSLKEKLEENGSFFISPSVAEYIENNFDRDPVEVNKVVSITEFFGKQLQEKFDLNHVPEKIMVEWVLGDTEKSYHVKGKVFKNQKYSPIFYVPKTQVFENLYEKDVQVEVDFDTYQEKDKRGWRAFKHQEEGIKFLLSKNKCILADDMGLGKTYQSIVAALEAGAEKILVVCPANAKINWFREISNFVPEEDITILKTGHWN